MARTNYTINKGINRSIVFKGLKGQYIWYAGGAMFMVMVLYGLLYAIGVNNYLCLLIAVCMAALSIMAVFQLSATYGEHGLTKAWASRKVPRLVKAKSRKRFSSKTIIENGKASR
ncbi:DUF4133 domain-containing protein [Dyadobacter sp. CY261]|uniref:DUF4133 domain-containing protein n=1 Tax=Dyadobacter sp. CY261 TaxID=2907203 RepID=UPI001F370E15|nr:DUF4133 domain-containing protein [Dyadobacter sp. CY261]MCF0075403.1 DUF4133 domain-containing protein [Dyadobacter sp. CY261]